MTVKSTHHRTASALAVTPLLALLLVAGCSEQQSSAPQETASTESVTTAVMEPEPAPEPAAAEPVEAPEPVAMAEETGTAAAADGEGIYNKACKVCHAAGVAGAPKLGDSEAWAPRVAKGEEALFGSIKKGLNAMPPKGACMTCSDDELKSALEYMLSQTG